MRPTYEELLQINSLLGSKSHEEVEALIDAIEECGYTWDTKQRAFHNPKISRTIRTQGLDMFTPEKVKNIHKDIYQEYQDNPEQYNLHAHGMSIWSRWVPRLVILFILDLVFGWLILPLGYWLGSLAFIVLLFFFMKQFFVVATMR